jgi:hypothetical protein
VQDSEGEFNKASENVIDPVTPPLEVLSATLSGDITQRVTADFFPHRDCNVSDFAGSWMDVAEFEMAASSVNRLVSHFDKRVHEFPR